MALVYIHKTKDTDRVFYVGIATNKRRPNDCFARSLHWKNLVNKHGRIVEIVRDGLTKAEACKMEAELILKYGRKDLKTGYLVNMTNVGESFPEMSQEGKRKQIAANKKVWEDKEFKDKIISMSKARWKDPEFRKMKIASVKKMWSDPEYLEKRKGIKMPSGANNGMSKKLIILETGVILDSLTEAEKIFGKAKRTITNWLTKRHIVMMYSDYLKLSDEERVELVKNPPHYGPNKLSDQEALSLIKRNKSGESAHRLYKSLGGILTYDGVKKTCGRKVL